MLDKSYTNKYNSELNGYGLLTQGEVNDIHFGLLMSVFRVSNARMMLALKDFLVYGKSRKMACSENNVSQSYFSIKLKQLQILSQTMARACIYYLCVDKI